MTITTAVYSVSRLAVSMELFLLTNLKKSRTPAMGFIRGEHSVQNSSEVEVRLAVDGSRKYACSTPPYPASLRMTSVRLRLSISRKTAMTMAHLSANNIDRLSSPPLKIPMKPLGKP